MVFNLDKLKVGNAIRISCKRLGFEIDCIVVVATENELNLAYYDKERGCMEYQALIVEDVRYGDYEIVFLN
ncbi:hypothetical protein O0E53_09485 [Clostridioides difficile]|nr:hypothetical protein [Clostridioides difficile]MCI4688844.1 hypothetical protein [Clostridioides difficile]MDB6346551.1 hypothetical protein [Clostridioides difficile]OFU34191.1 hypothetical protein HMPREF3075_04530 [Clostridium sp. HMSC19B11]